ncbi:hypothetical protein [Belnapia moabensis]|uniref:hypothetical protein n=1 Tax=Belnapia moabensis TaxID=365533 RepID=UPI0012EDE2C7|nr:hypothetical protein [Belnapia moabensis]
MAISHSRGSGEGQANPPAAVLIALYASPPIDDRSEAGCYSTQLLCMSPSSDPPPAKPKITADERRQRDAERLQIIRLRMLVGQALHDRGITTPAAIGAAIGMAPAEATKLMTGKQWRAGDVELLEAAAASLRLQVPGYAASLNETTYHRTKK